MENAEKGSSPEFVLLDKITKWGRLNSPWAIHYNSGSCNGCDIELLTVTTPRYDAERFGVKMVGSPRHADVLIVTGAVTMQSKDRLIQTYEQMPEPRFVMALGSCGISGGVFAGCYCIEGGVDKVIPVDVYVPGCPPRPEAILQGIITLLNKINGKGIDWDAAEKPQFEIVDNPIPTPISTPTPTPSVAKAEPVQQRENVSEIKDVPQKDGLTQGERQ